MTQRAAWPGSQDGGAQAALSLRAPRSGALPLPAALPVSGGRAGLRRCERPRPRWGCGGGAAVGAFVSGPEVTL
ncbi:hypothetical protein DV515_00001979 [Chloebia gouldiae]|uniref:Uncharacterized protein n=1 Tax=Chloebia gouldiae TaxID=44316 RepID=A0A3L8SYX4_CHLGU|nr:hypothetical protein DV515_00001979 [Chloebia gouldiae]